MLGHLSNHLPVVRPKISPGPTAAFLGTCSGHTRLGLDERDIVGRMLVAIRAGRPDLAFLWQEEQEEGGVWWCSDLSYHQGVLQRGVPGPEEWERRGWIIHPNVTSLPTHPCGACEQRIVVGLDYLCWSCRATI